MKQLSIVEAAGRSLLGREGGVIITPVYGSGQRLSALLQFAEMPEFAELVNYRDYHYRTKGRVRIAGITFYNVCGCCPVPSPRGRSFEWAEYERAVKTALGKTNIRLVGVRGAGNNFNRMELQSGMRIVEFEKMREERVRRYTQDNVELLRLKLAIDSKKK